VLKRDVKLQLTNKAIVDYTSPELCTPVTPFRPTDDAAYRQHSGAALSHGHGQHARKFGKDGACSSADILACARDTQTDILITILPPAGEVTRRNQPQGEYRALADISRSALYCHSNETRAPIANPPNSAQLGDIIYHSPSYNRIRAVVWTCGRGQTDTQTHVTNIHFASSTTHAKVINANC